MTHYFNNFLYFLKLNCSFSIQFQVDLKSISAEIQTLQEQSLRMNIRLKNRQVKALFFYNIYELLNLYADIRYPENCVQLLTLN